MSHLKCFDLPEAQYNVKLYFDVNVLRSSPVFVDFAEVDILKL